MTDTRPIVVTLHAVDQLRGRRPAVYGELTDRIVCRVIRHEVAEALAAGRVSDRKPIGFRLHREKKAGALTHQRQRFVWTPSGELGFIVAREDCQDVVLTTLTRASAAE